MIKNRLHLSPLPAVNTTKHLFNFFPHISSSVKVLRIRMPMAKHSFRDNCSIVLVIPYYVLYLLGLLCVHVSNHLSIDGSDPSANGSDRPMASAKPPHIQMFCLSTTNCSRVLHQSVLKLGPFLCSRQPLHAAAVTGKDGGERQETSTLLLPAGTVERRLLQWGPAEGRGNTASI